MWIYFEYKAEKEEKKKAKEGGKDIENMNDAKEAYAQWVSEGKPDVTNMNKRKRRKGR